MTDSVLKQDPNTQTVKKKANLIGQYKHVRIFDLSPFLRATQQQGKKAQ